MARIIFSEKAFPFFRGCWSGEEDRLFLAGVGGFSFNNLSDEFARDFGDILQSSAALSVEIPFGTESGEWVPAEKL